MTRTRPKRWAYSKSIPSSLYFDTILVTVLTKLVRLDALPTAVEKYRDPVHPPMESDAVTFCNQVGSGHVYCV